MSKPNSDGGFPLPLVIDPPRICITLEIPDEDAHLRAFWGCLWDLTRWFNWQVDDDKTAKRVADVWLEVYLANHLDWRERLCDMPENCCDETNDLLRKILKVMEGGFKIVPLESSLPKDFIVDCTPANFQGNEGDTYTEEYQRYKALCLGVTRWMIAIMYDWAVDMNLTTRLDDVLALAGLAKAPNFTSQIETVPQFQTVPEFNQILNSPDGFIKAVCLLIDNLRERGNTFSEFLIALGQAEVQSRDDEDNAVQIAAAMAQLYGASRINYTVFSKALESAFEDIKDGEDFDCGCLTIDPCTPADFDFIGLNGTVVTRLTVDTWNVTQINHVPEAPASRKFVAAWRDRNWRCYNFFSATSGSSRYDNIGCDGNRYEGTGGGTGDQRQTGFITFEQNGDPLLGINMTIYCICASTGI